MTDLSAQTANAKAEPQDEDWLPLRWRIAAATAVGVPYKMTPDPDVEAVLQARLEAVLAVVLPLLAEKDAEISQLTQRVPYREGETEVEYLHRMVARWRSETYQARTRASSAEVERDQLLDILVTQVRLHRARQGHQELSRRGCQTCPTFRDLAETEAFKAAEARRIEQIAEALRTGNFIACPTSEEDARG